MTKMINKQELRKEYRETTRNIKGFLNHSLEYTEFSSLEPSYEEIIKTASKEEIIVFENDVKNYFQEYLHNPYINISNYEKEKISNVICNYCKYIRKDSWEEIHDLLLTDHLFAFSHLKKVIKTSWEKYEIALEQKMSVKRIYNYSLIANLPKKLHNFLMASAIIGNKYAIRYAKRLEETLY
jgi:hypothetical protein